MPIAATDTRSRLAESAFHVFAEHGLDGSNLDAVAARAGVTKGSLYHHYSGKKDLVLASCRYYYRRWHQMIQQECAQEKDPLARLRAVLNYSVRTCLIDEKNRVFTTDLFALSLNDTEVRDSWAQFYDSVRESYIGFVSAAKSSGQLCVADPRRATNLMLAAMEGLKQRASFEPEISVAAEQERLVEDLLSIVGYSRPQAKSK